MGEAKRKKIKHDAAWPQAGGFRGVIEMHQLPPAPSINGQRLSELTGDPSFASVTQIALRAFRAMAGERSFHVGFCVGDETGVSPVGLAVVERLALEAPHTPLHVVPVRHEDIASDLVLRHLRTFAGQALLFACSDSDVYDAGVRPVSFSPHIQQFIDGEPCKRLTPADLRRIQAKKAAMLDRPPPPIFYPVVQPGVVDAPWIFHIVTPAGKKLRTAVWNGRRDYAHDFPEDIVRWVGGDRIAIVQVDSPVGVDRRSSFDLTHQLARDFDGIIHWARDTATFQSIVASFVRLEIDSASPPELPHDWVPEIVIMPARGT